MNLKLKRLVRTNTSEQYALYDLDQSDGDDQPLIIGKVDLHFTGEGVYGTLLLWDESTRRLRSAQRRAFVNAILREITQPMGVPNEFVVEFFMPSLDAYELFHNVGADEGELEEDELAEYDLDDEEIDADELGEDDLDALEIDEDEEAEDDRGETAAAGSVGQAVTGRPPHRPQRPAQPS
ncbi:MAG: hypothetical protein KDE19_04655 [Caldilineaceae bacterium]|nr:hypothetical protein [Caldilineaceae bacterium]